MYAILEIEMMDLIKTGSCSFSPSISVLSVLREGELR